MPLLQYLRFFFFKHTATTQIYTLSLHDALPIYNLESKPRLAVAEHPVAVSMGPDGAPASPVHFRMYDNYASFLKRAEIRIFNPDQSLQAVPLASIPIDEKGLAEWQPPAERLRGPARELKFVLRAYDAKGHF